MMKILSIIFLSFCIIFISACGNKNKGDPNAIVDEKELEAKIKALLVGCEINISELDNTLQTTDTLKLDDTLYASSRVARVYVRNRGVLVNENHVVTSVNVRKGNVKEGLPRSVYVALFDGKGKKLLSSVPLGPHFDVLSILKDKSDDTIVLVDALVREQGQPAKKIQIFKVKVMDGTLALQ